MEDLLNRTWEMFIGRTSGPFTFRFVFAPTIASILAVRAGLKDIKNNRQPYFLAILSQKNNRRLLLGEGRKDIGKMFIIMSILDAIYQIIVFQWVYPGQVLIVAVFLAICPYLLVRGLVVRIGNIVRPDPDKKSLGDSGYGRRG